MAQLDTLGFTSRTGGVDDIGQVVGIDLAGWIVGRLPSEFAHHITGAIQVKFRHVDIGPIIGKVTFGDEDGRLGIFDHQLQAAFGEGGIKGDIGGTGLENAQQPNQQFRRTFDTEAHQIIGFDA